MKQSVSSYICSQKCTIIPKL